MKRSRKFFPFLAIAAFLIYFTWAAITPDLPTLKNPIVFYSNQAGQDFRFCLKEAIKQAKESIHITMYGFSDPDMAKLLQKKALEGIDVKVFYDARGSEHLLSPPVQAYPLKGKGLKHRKIVVIDQHLSFLGSANMTPSSLMAHDNLSVGLYHPELAAYLISNPKAPFFFDQGEVWLLPHPQALERIISLLESAKHHIFVSMFTFTHPRLIEALIAAKNRGVSVTVAVDYYAGRGAGEKAVKRLQESGIKILLSLGQQLLHHKWMVLDDTVVLGSANWTKAGFSANQDFFILFKDLSPVHKAYFSRLSKIISLESNEAV